MLKRKKVKLLAIQSCLTLCNPMDGNPPGSSVHGILQARILGVGCHSLLQGIFPTQGSNLGLSHCRQNIYHLNHQESPSLKEFESICYLRRSSPILTEMGDLLQIFRSPKRPMTQIKFSITALGEKYKIYVLDEHTVFAIVSLLWIICLIIH